MAASGGVWVKRSGGALYGRTLVARERLSSATLRAPEPPADASVLVREAYLRGLSSTRVGITAADRRSLNAAVRRGDLVYQQNLNMPGRQMRWVPVYR